MQDQEKALQKTAGAEETYITTREILHSEKNRHRQVGKYMEIINHSLSLEIKRSYISMLIYGDYENKRTVE